MYNNVCEREREKESEIERKVHACYLILLLQMPGFMTQQQQSFMDSVYRNTLTKSQVYGKEYRPRDSADKPYTCPCGKSFYHRHNMVRHQRTAHADIMGSPQQSQQPLATQNENHQVATDDYASIPSLTPSTMPSIIPSTIPSTMPTTLPSTLPSPPSLHQAQSPPNTDLQIKQENSD